MLAGDSAAPQTAGSPNSESLKGTNSKGLSEDILVYEGKSLRIRLCLKEVLILCTAIGLTNSVGPIIAGG